MLIFCYPTKKELKANVGKALRFEETSIFGPEYKADGELYGSNRPAHTGIGKVEYYAKVTMKDGLIVKVS